VNRYNFNGTTCGPENENLAPEGLHLRPFAAEQRNRVAWVRRSTGLGVSEPFCAVWGKDWQQAERRAQHICNLLDEFDAELREEQQ
jgi:hypothetical protein